MANEEVRVVGRFARFGGMTWPVTVENVEWRLRYAPESITRGDQLFLASVVASYEALIHKTRCDREAVIPRLREAYALAARSPEPSEPT